MPVRIDHALRVIWKPNHVVADAVVCLGSVAPQSGLMIFKILVYTHLRWCAALLPLCYKSDTVADEGTGEYTHPDDLIYSNSGCPIKIGELICYIKLARSSSLNVDCCAN